jgi:hypothetical protein
VGEGSQALVLGELHIRAARPVEAFCYEALQAAYGERQWRALHLARLGLLLEAPALRRTELADGARPLAAVGALLAALHSLPTAAAGACRAEMLPLRPAWEERLATWSVFRLRPAVQRLRTGWRRRR